MFALRRHDNSQHIHLLSLSPPAAASALARRTPHAIRLRVRRGRAERGVDCAVRGRADLGPQAMPITSSGRAHSPTGRITDSLSESLRFPLGIRAASRSLEKFAKAAIIVDVAVPSTLKITN